MNNPKRLLIILVAVLLAAATIVVIVRKNNNNSPETLVPNPTPVPAPTPVIKQVVAPMASAGTRITKKPFGIYITPKTSPVQPEKFTGYHTGTDFETTPDEQNIDIQFNAICAGKILTKRFATGYGGVFVQSCAINGQAVTVVYGHVSLKSITKNVGDSLVQGEKIGNLGHSPDETDGERKHLHLGIHIGTAVNITGYVTKLQTLESWLDFQKL